LIISAIDNCSSGTLLRGVSLDFDVLVTVICPPLSLA